MIEELEEPPASRCSEPIDGEHQLCGSLGVRIVYINTGQYLDYSDWKDGSCETVTFSNAKVADGYGEESSAA